MQRFLQSECKITLTAWILDYLIGLLVKDWFYIVILKAWRLRKLICRRFLRETFDFLRRFLDRTFVLIANLVWEQIVCIHDDCIHAFTQQPIGIASCLNYELFDYLICLLLQWIRVFDLWVTIQIIVCSLNETISLCSCLFRAHS